MASLWRGSFAILGSALCNCALPVVAGLSLNEVSSAGSLVSTLATGKGLGEHALDLATGRDCRILEGLTRKDRGVCEPEGSPATAGDFKGIGSLLSFEPDASTSAAKHGAMGPVAGALGDDANGGRIGVQGNAVLAAYSLPAAGAKLIANRRSSERTAQ